jgi:hypothetical protein
VFVYPELSKFKAIKNGFLNFIPFGRDWFTIVVYPNEVRCLSWDSNFMSSFLRNDYDTKNIAAATKDTILAILRASNTELKLTLFFANENEWELPY